MILFTEVLYLQRSIILINSLSDLIIFRVNTPIKQLKSIIMTVAVSLSSILINTIAIMALAKQRMRRTMLNKGTDLTTKEGAIMIIKVGKTEQSVVRSLQAEIDYLMKAAADRHKKETTGAAKQGTKRKRLAAQTTRAWKMFQGAWVSLKINSQESSNQRTSMMPSQVPRASVKSIANSSRKVDSSIHSLIS